MILQTAKISYVGVNDNDQRIGTVKVILNRVKAALNAAGDGVVRICIPALGAPDWGDLTGTVGLHLHRYPSV